MKNYYYILTTIIFLVNFSPIYAQEDLSGIYCDGIKADSITCWTFKEMELVFPVQDIEKWKKFDRIELVWNFSYKAGSEYTKPLAFFSENISDYILPGAEYVVWTVMKDVNTDRFYFKFNNRTQDFSRADFGAYQKACRTCDGLEPYTRFFHLEIEGSFVTGYYDDDNGNITKKYGNSVTLYKSQKVPLFIESVGVFSSPANAKTLKTPGCVISGTKVDLIKVPAGGYVKNIELIMGKEKVTNVTNERTIITTSVVKSSSQLQALDKSKSNYFEEKDTKGKLIREGYKEQGKYHGEVREYINGVLSQVIIFSNGMQDGLLIQYDEKGKVQVEANYKNGQLDGMFKTYNNGILISTKTFVNGKEK